MALRGFNVLLQSRGILYIAFDQLRRPARLDTGVFRSCAAPTERLPVARQPVDPFQHVIDGKRQPVKLVIVTCEGTRASAGLADGFGGG